MAKFLINIISVIITSFYFFPFEFIFLPGINTKMVLAGIGLLVLGQRLAQKGHGNIDGNFFNLSLIALGISLVSLITMTYNDTNDNSFLTYFVSMWVWLGGAYTVVRWLEFAYGYVSVRLICNHLIGVCVMQCIIALSIDYYAPLKNFVNGFLGGEAFMGNAGNRLYGIGAALDVAGLRFATVAVMIGFMLSKSKDFSNKQVLGYLFSFFIIAIIGNMMSRTTTVGIVIALLYLCYCAVINTEFKENKRLLVWFGVFLCVVIPVVTLLYHTNETFYRNIRFAFEGFFSLWETGEWNVTSNDILFEHMIVFPETLTTWIIGDGYAANPENDPFYNGPDFVGYYMDTDVGYLRYIFYFGLTGTILFTIFMLKAALICANKFKAYKVMFILLLLVNYIGWFKVSTDVFLAFAPFLCLNEDINDLQSDL